MAGRCLLQDWRDESKKRLRSAMEACFATLGSSGRNVPPRLNWSGVFISALVVGKACFVRRT